MGKMKKAQTGDSLKRTRTAFRPGASSYDRRGTKMKTDYSVDTAGYAAGKKRFPSSITVSEVNRPSKSATTKTTIGRKKVSKLIGQKRNGGSVKSKVSKKKK